MMKNPYSYVESNQSQKKSLMRMGSDSDSDDDSDESARMNTEEMERILREAGKWFEYHGSLLLFFSLCINFLIFLKRV